MDWQKATWISGDTSCTAPMFRQDFAVEALEKATITICGLGFFELYLNGARVGDDLFVPVWSNYEKRENRRLLYPLQDEFSNYRTYYLEYDVTAYLRQGENAIGVLLGNGWYHQIRRVEEGDLDYGFPKLCFALRITRPDGTIQEIVSSPEMKWSESEIVENNIFYGELHDLRKRQESWSEPGFPDTGWKQAQVAAPPETNFSLQDCPTDKKIRAVQPVLVLEDGERRIYDCQENITGFVELRCPAEEGKRITVRHSEELNAECTQLDFTSTGKERQIQMDEYLCAGQESLCHPKFCWHGFRYFEVIGNAAVERAWVVHSDVPVTSSFSCSDPVLNWIYEAYVRTQLENLHCAVPSDCPHRERLGYCGDGQVTARSAMMCLGIRSFYRKWMDDIADCQDRNTGHVQHTAPFYGGGGGPGGWGGAVYLIPAMYYEYYGEKEFPEKYYPNMRRWLDYMDSRCEDGLIVREEPGGWCLGEWCTPGAPKVPEALINTYYYIKGLRTVIFFAELLGIPEDLELLRERQRRSEAAWIQAYYSPETGSFCDGANGADAFAVDLGLGDERTLQNLIRKYQATKTFDTGIFGTDLLIDILFQHGQAELAYQLLTSRTETSFAKMMEHGATTLWEFWDGSDSHNHPMLGGSVRAFFTYLLGIKQKPGSAGFRDIVIEPADIPGLSWAKGHITTPAGKISVSYTRDEDGHLAVSSECLPG